MVGIVLGGLWERVVAAVHAGVVQVSVGVEGYV